MKNITRGILSLLVACATSASYGGQPPNGVAGVDVVVKQNPSKRAVTDARGNFALDSFGPGSYTVSFRARKAGNIRMNSTERVRVASSYSIKIDGAKRSVSQSGLTSDKLLAGVDLKIEVGAGAKVRGQVLAGETKQMVWIPREPGSHIPGHWAEVGSDAAKARRSDTQTLSPEELTNTLNRGNPNMWDPVEPRSPFGPQTSGR